MTDIIFYFLSSLVLLASVGVVVLKNPVYSALSLIATLLGVACIFALMQAHFLAVVQVIVYAGAIMVLVLFVIMLLNVKTESYDSRVLIPGTFSFALVVAAIYGFLHILPGGILTPLPKSDGLLVGDAKSIGKLLFTDYLFAFEFASVLIMAALVGAVLLGKVKYKK